jgi:hypothetical protein
MADDDGVDKFGLNTEFYNRLGSVMKKSGLINDATGMRSGPGVGIVEDSKA